MYRSSEMPGGIPLWNADPASHESSNGLVPDYGDLTEITTAAKAVMTAFPDAIDVLVDGGETPGGAPSTLVDTTTTPFLILREGAVTSAAIRRILTGPLATWAPEEP